ARDRSQPHRGPTYERYQPPHVRDLNAPRSAFAPATLTAASRKQSCSARVAAPMKDRVRSLCPRAPPSHTTTTSDQPRPCPECPRPRRYASPLDTPPATASRGTDRQPARSDVSPALLHQTPRRPSSRRGSHPAQFLRRRRAQDY